jgi:hypothetical protein
MNDNNRTEIVFDGNLAENPLLEAAPLGPGAPNHIADAKVEAWLGRRPVVYDLARMLEAQKIPIPEQFTLLNDHEIWVVFYAFGIHQRSNFNEVVRSRFEVEYAENPAVTIFQLFPTTELTTWGVVDVAGELCGKFAKEVQLSEETASASADSDKKGKVIPIPGLLDNAQANVKVGGKVSLSLNLKVATSKLTAAGINNDYGLWEFRKHDVPLVGDQQVGHVLLIKKPAASAISTIKVKLRFSIDVGYFSFWTSKRSTPWNDIELSPPDGKSSVST